MIGLSIFRCRSEIAWELTPNESGSQNTKDFAVWCGLVSKARGFNERAGVCRVVRFTTQFFFILDKAKAIPIRIGTQTAWEAVSLDFIDNKDKKLQQKITAR